MDDLSDVPSIIDTGYTLLTGLEKRDFLFDAGIRATAYADDDQPDVSFGVVQFAESALDSFAHQRLIETITRSSDELDPPKHKLFHTYGTTAKVVFTPTADSPYAGIFHETAHGLLRFSYAGPIVGVGMVPGLGIKFPIDGNHPSENAVLMRKLDGQATRSVFENPFTNILPDPMLTNLIMREVRKRFETVVQSPFGLHQALDNLACASIAGDPVDSDARAPYRLILMPTAAARQLSDPALDFRLDLSRNFSPRTQLYDVLAIDESQETEVQTRELDELVPIAHKIGTLTTESEFIASRYGDFRLFFRHSAVYLRPELARTT